MCRACAKGYQAPRDRRFHAQPVACPICGPRLALLDGQGRPLGEEPIEGAVRLLRAGHIVAIKGLGGYHLAADANDERAVTSLRGRKHREEKPFALMARDVAAVHTLAELGPEEERLLTSPRRAIVLSAAGRTPGWPTRSPPETGSSGSCSPTPRFTTCWHASWTPRSSRRRRLGGAAGACCRSAVAALTPGFCHPRPQT
jgi:hydrogenase maturation protein HypF